MSNEIITYCLGMDVDKHTFKACLVARLSSGMVQVKSSTTFANTADGFKELLAWKAKHVKKHDIACSFVMEATGVYHEHLAHFLNTKQECVCIVLATKAKRYLQSLGIKTKNDKSDALGLATMGAQQCLQQWKPVSKELYGLRSLTRQAEALQEARTVFNNQLEGVTHAAVVDKAVIKSIKSLIKKVDKEITKFHKKIKKTIQEDEALRSKYKLFEGLKGFGIMTFAVIVAETGGFELFESQAQVVSYSGYDIVENSSGKRTGKTKISKKGNAHIRRAMHMSSLGMVRYKIPIFERLYHKVYERTKIKMKGYVAVQRKLLCLVYHLWNKNEAFDINHQTKDISLDKEPRPSFGSVPKELEKKEAVPAEPVLR